MPTIAGREATVRTAIIEIRALRVSGKQMTQALFQQLEEKPFYETDDSDAEGYYPFRGTLWGRVNYHGGCGTDEAHHHVVWQEGDELRRYNMRKRGMDGTWRRWEKHLDTLRSAMLCCLLTTEVPLVAGIPLTDEGSLKHADSVTTQQVDFPPSPAHGSSLSFQVVTHLLFDVKTMHLGQQRGRYQGSTYVDERTPPTAADRQRAVLQLQDYLHPHADWQDRNYASLRQWHDAAAGELLLRQARWEAIWKEVAELAQLFIAV